MSVLDDFLQGAPDGVGPALAALACAESLTDKVAHEIYEKVPVPGLTAEQFVSAFKYSGLTEPRNSEWNLDHELRDELVRSSFLSSDAKHSVHRYLADLGEKTDLRGEAGRTIPTYLFSEAGLAYHLAGSGNTSAALEHYSRAAQGPFNGAQWLGAKLVKEQEQTGVIPEGQIETTFLRALVLLRQGRKKEAMPLFEKVAKTDAEKREVAISLHLLGNGRPPRRSKQAGTELRRSIEIGESLGDLFHVAQTLHSFANFLGRQAGHRDEAEKVYRESIEIGESLGDRSGVAKTLHSFANFLGRQAGHRDEAAEAYRESIEIGESLGDRSGVAKTLHSFANFLSRQAGRRDEAAEAYRESIEIGESLGEPSHVAQTLHSFANFLSRQAGCRDEAEKAYRESIKIGESLGEPSHVAQTFRSYALAIKESDPEQALNLLERSHEINERLGNRNFADRVMKEIQQLRTLISQEPSGPSL